jgi:hypothetical protein
MELLEYSMKMTEIDSAGKCPAAPAALLPGNF